jgi:hypothetical protein
MITYNTRSRKGAALCVLALTTAALVSGCKKSPEKSTFDTKSNFYKRFISDL